MQIFDFFTLFLKFEWQIVLSLIKIGKTLPICRTEIKIMVNRDIKV